MTLQTTPQRHATAALVCRATLWRRYVGGGIAHVSLASAMVGVLACHDLSGTPELPAGIQSPSVYNTPSGALQQARGVMGLLRTAINVDVVDGGMFTDELTGATAFALKGNDARRPSDNTKIAGYEMFQQVRGQARLARGALLSYAPNIPSDVRGQVYALEAYAEVFLADMYCSGIPLSTVDFDGGFTYQPGSSTADVYRHAAALFDTAAALAIGNDSIEMLARVGWGRALLSLDLADSAAHVVALVADTALYRVRIEIGSSVWPTEDVQGTVADREGVNGLPYVSSQDPRTRTTGVAVNIAGTQTTSLVPSKYVDIVSGDSTSVVLASGIEARLIAAEADLAHDGTEWLTILNALRTNGHTTVTVRTDIPGRSPGPAGYPDTTWGPGTGVGLLAPSAVADVKPVCSATGPCTDTVWYRGLHPLADPGAGLTAEAAKTARVDLLFRERAFWLFLTGHRQGDLRRLVRQYGRQPNRVFPTGTYGGPEGVYGDAVVFPIPISERLNPKFKGCLNYGA